MTSCVNRYIATDKAAHPDAESVARFLADLSAADHAGTWWPDRLRVGNTMEPQHREEALALAVSGGPDSLALLLLAHEAMAKRGGRIEAATVDHQLRCESGQEAAMVARVCADLAIPHQTLTITVPSGNCQAEARIARYDALADWMIEHGLSVLATAHHADDQAETLLMRLNRGSGVAGLAGVRARTVFPGTKFAGGRILRPLLFWRRSTLAQIVSAAGLTPADDPSNRNHAYDRARLRAKLDAADWLNVTSIAASASHLADADQALDWAAMREWNENVQHDGSTILWQPQVPRAIALRVLAQIVLELDGNQLRGGTLARTYDRLAYGQAVSVAQLIAKPCDDGWRFTPAPPRHHRPKA